MAELVEQGLRLHRCRVLDDAVAGEGSIVGRACIVFDATKRTRGVAECIVETKVACQGPGGTSDWIQVRKTRVAAYGGDVFGVT
jgi:hypothetical protein